MKFQKRLFKAIVGICEIVKSWFAPGVMLIWFEVYQMIRGQPRKKLIVQLLVIPVSGESGV